MKGDDRMLKELEEPGCTAEVRARFLTHPLLEGYWNSEKVAIFRLHKKLHCQLRRDVGVKETVQVWESGACLAWRRDKMRLDGQRQLEEIERHKFLVSQQLGYDIGWEQAAMDWIERHASDWRQWWENQSEACPSRDPDLDFDR